MVQDEIPFDQTTRAPGPSGSAASSSSGSPFAGSDDAHSFVDRLAAPLDRLASVVGDLVLFIPLAALAVAPFRRQALVAQLMNREEAWSFALMGAFGAAILVALVYQTLFVALFGGTPGKLVLGLRVQSIWDGAKPRPMAAFLRSLAWCVELFALGIPWISAFANERRRPFHDRIADTAVVTIGRRLPAGPPSLPEMSMASGAYSAMLASAALVIVLSLLQLKRTPEPAGKFVAEMESKGLLCSVVGEAKEDWVSSDAGKVPPRLAVAVALYGAGAIDEACLELEADFAIWRGKDRALAYLAKGLAKDEEAMRDSYLSKVCEFEREGDACELARFMRLSEEGAEGAETESAEERAELAVSQAELETLIENFEPGRVEYLMVWMIRHLSESREYARVLELTKTPSPSRKLGHFYASERARALWYIDRKEEARVAFRSAVETFDVDERVGLSRWLCYQETEAGRCQERASQNLWPCELLSAAIERDDRWLTDSEVAVTYIRGETCRSGDDAETLTRLEGKISDLEARAYLRALIALKGEKSEEGLKLLRSLANDHEREGPFFFEANVKLIELARSGDDLEPVVASWQKSEPREEWVALGHRLVSRLSSFEAWGRALEIGIRMMESDHVDRETQKLLVVAAYRSGRRDLALGFLESYARAEERGVQARAPASHDEGERAFEEAVRELMVLGPAEREAK